MTKKSYSFLLVFYSAYVSAQTINSFPYSQSFDSQIPCATSAASPCPLTLDWQNALDDDIDWTATDQPTPTGTTGPDFDHTSGAGIFLYLESSGNGAGYPNKTAHLLSPYYNFTAVSSPRLRFWYHVFGFNMGNLYVDVRQGSAGAWTQVAGPLTGDLDQWQLGQVNLTSYAGLDSIQLRMRGTTGTGFYSDLAIDDIELLAGVGDDLAVVGVSGLPQSSCQVVGTFPTIRILNNGSNTLNPGTSIPVGFSAGAQVWTENIILAAPFASGDTLDFTYTSALNLSAVGEYALHFWTDYPTDLVNTANDTLHGGVVDQMPHISQYPYYQDFENGRGGWTSFNNSNGAVNGSWDFGTPSKRTIIGAASGRNAWTTGGLTTLPYNNGERSWVLSPCFDFSTLCNPWLELSVWWASEYEWDGASLQITTDGGTTWQTIGQAFEPNNWYNTDTIAAYPGTRPMGWSGGGSFTPNGSGTWLQARHDLRAFAGVANAQFRLAFASDNVYNDDGFAFDNIHIYDGVSFADLGDTLVVCGSNGLVLDAKGDALHSYLWSTGSTAQTITVSTTGTYSVTTTQAACTAVDTLVVIQSNYPVVSMPDTVDVCNEYTLDAGSNGAFYEWSNGETAASFTTPFGGLYQVTVTNALGCQTLDSILVEIRLSGFLDLGADTSFCTELLFAADPNFSQYQWSTGDTTFNTIFTESGTYVLTAYTPDGCASVDSIVATRLLPTAWSLGSDAEVCGFIALNPNLAGTYDYLWSDGSTGSTFLVSATGLYWLEIASGTCRERDSIELTIFDLPTIDLGVDTTICAGDSLLLDAGAFASYQWSNGSNDASQYVSQGTYSVTVTDANNCSNSDAIVVTEEVCGGVREAAEATGLLLYPNPVRNALHLRSEVAETAVHLSIYNAWGQVVYAQAWAQVAAGEAVEIAWENLPAGAYWLHWTSEAQTQVLPFVAE